jgi:hypothetical protein
MTDPEQELLELGRRALTPSPAQRAALRARVDRAIAAPPVPTPWRGWLLPSAGLGGVIMGALLLWFLWPSGSPDSDRPGPAPEDGRAVGVVAPGAAEDPGAEASLERTGVREEPAQDRAPSSASADTLDRELRLLGAARRSLARGQVDAALGALEEHARAFPNGVLAEERAALYVRALCDAGNEPEARRRLAAFREHYPGSVSLPTLRESCAGTAGPD